MRYLTFKSTLDGMLGLDNHFDLYPGLAQKKARQPWALRRNPFRDLNSNKIDWNLSREAKINVAGSLDRLSIDYHRLKLPLPNRVLSRLSENQRPFGPDDVRYRT